MANFTRLEVLNKMNDTGLVPLFYNNNIEECKEIIAACYRGGARVIEYTARGDFAQDIFAELSRYAIVELPDLALGVGSLTDAASASLYLQNGANFIVTPVLREDIAIICNRRKVLWLPGCGSLSEITRAEELGCDMIKLFPGSVYGPEFVNAVKGPQPWTSIMPTGGVTTDKENLKKWFGAGVTCVGIGSNLISKNNHGKYDLEEIENLTQKTLEYIKSLN